MQSIRFFSAFVLLSLALPGSAAQAVEVSPMISILEPTGSKSSYRMRVKNNESFPVTVEFETYRMDVDEAGNRTLTDEKNDLLVFPPQSIIPPGREQIVQVRFIGNLADKPGAMYVVRVAQLPVDLTTKVGATTGAVMRIAFNVSTNVYVAPPKTVGKLDVRSITRKANGDVVAAVENTGNGFALLRQATYVFTDKSGRKITVDPAKVEVGDVSALAAGRRRLLHFTADQLKAGAAGDLELNIQLL